MPLAFSLLLKVAYADYTHYHSIGAEASSEASAFVNRQAVCVYSFSSFFISSSERNNRRYTSLKRSSSETIFWECSPSLVFLAWELGTEEGVGMVLWCARYWCILVVAPEASCSSLLLARDGCG